MNSGNGEFEDTIRGAFQDPHPELNRTPVILIVDSKKIRVAKSSDKHLQRDDYYKPSNTHNETMYTICTPSGLPVFQAAASASSTPR